MIPKVTVLTPTYKRPELLYETIRSVLGQTFTDFEYIIGSDGIDDNTRQVARMHMNDNRVRFVEAPHSGQFRNLSMLVSMAKGKYVAILSDDDTWEPTFLEQCVAALEARDHRYVLAYTDYYVFKDGSKTPVLEERRCNLTYESLRHDCLINTSATVFVREYLEKSRDLYGFYYDPEVRYTCGDWLMWLRLSKLGPFLHVHELLSNYRLNPNSITLTRKSIFALFEGVYVRNYSGVGTPLRTAFDTLFWKFLWDHGIAQAWRRVKEGMR